MTASSLGDDAAAVHAAVVSVMGAGLVAGHDVKQACRAGGAVPIEHADLDRLSIKARVPTAEAPTLLPVLKAAAMAGHLVMVRHDTGDAALTITWMATGRTLVEVDGSPGDLVAQAAVDLLDRATTRGDAAAALSLLPDNFMDVELVLRPEAGGGHWVPTAGLLADRLSDGRWGSTLLRLRPGHPGVPAVVVVQDAGADLICCPGIVLAGPEADLAGNAFPSAPPDASAAYRDARSLSATKLFVPADLLPAYGDAGGLEMLRSVLQSAVGVWYWLGSVTEIAADHVSVHFDGVRSVRLALVPYRVPDVQDELQLYVWATASADPVRADVVQQAVTFAIRDQTDVPGAAAPVLRTARSLHELASRGAVAEALAARRGAREAAVTAARAAATSASDAASSSVERSLALLLAVILALLAHGQALLSTAAAGAAVVVVALISLLFLWVADRVELESGRTLLDAFDDDVQLYREALGEDDLAAVKNLAALGAARADLRRVQTLVRVIYGGLAVVVLVGGTLLLQNDHGAGSAKPNPTPTPSVSVPATPRPTTSSTPSAKG